MQCLLSKLQYIHPIFKCLDLATHITQSTGSTQRAQTSLAEADHYSHMPTVKILRLGGERLPPPPPKKKKKKKKKKVLDHYLHQNLVMLLPLWCFLLIYFAHLLIAEGPQVAQILYCTAYSSPTYAQKI